jgi:hypothetical protein
MEFQPLHTRADKTIQTMVGLLVLEVPSGFPYRESNLYCVGVGGRIVWSAEKPDPNTLYSRVKLNEDGETISAYTTGGHACELNLRTGKLLSFISIK